MTTYLIDMSGSMQFHDVEKVAKTVLDRFAPGDRIFGFDHRVFELEPCASSILDTMRSASGGTHLQQAIDHVRNAEPNTNIVVFSDGMFESIVPPSHKIVFITIPELKVPTGSPHSLDPNNWSKARVIYSQDCVERWSVRSNTGERWIAIRLRDNSGWLWERDLFEYPRDGMSHD